MPLVTAARERARRPAQCEREATETSDGKKPMQRRSGQGDEVWSSEYRCRAASTEPSRATIARMTKAAKTAFVARSVRPVTALACLDSTLMTRAGRQLPALRCVARGFRRLQPSPGIRNETYARSLMRII